MKCRYKQKAKVNASIELFSENTKGTKATATTYILLIIWLERVTKILHFHPGECTRKMGIDETRTHTDTCTACNFMLWIQKGNPDE